MDTGQPDKSAATRRLSWRAFVPAGKWYAFAALIPFCFLLALQTPRVDTAFARLAWRLGPYRSFPQPYDPGGLASAITRHAEFMPTVVGLLGTLYLLSLAICVLHSACFGVAVLLHRLFGRPRYWHDVRERIDLAAAWALSAKRSWWAWPVVMSIGLVIEKLAAGFQHAFYPIIGTGAGYEILRIAAICLVFTIVASRVLQAAVIGAIRVDDLQCGRCRYLLRGLPVLRCPECGYEGHLSGNAEYGLLWPDPRRWSRTRRLIPLTLILILLTIPAWWPVMLSSLPRSRFRLVPVSTNLQAHDPNKLPLRPACVLVITRGGSVGIARLTQMNKARSYYEALYWSDAEDFRLAGPPDSRSDGRISWGGGLPLMIGPWQFGCQFVGVLGSEMIWLCRPDETYSVEAFEVDHLPDRLSWLREWLTDQPKSPQTSPTENATRPPS